MGLTRDPWYGSSLAALCVILAAGGIFLATRSSDGQTDNAVNATATATAAEPTSRPAATATPVPDPVTFDFARALDLLKVGQTLEAYFDENGAYPESGGEVVTLCEQTGDPGCVLTTIVVDVPFDDGEEPYWYVSDGATFTLIARAALTQEDTSACPDELPDALAALPVMCASGTGAQ
jgi:hypothetical protein